MMVRSPGRAGLGQRFIGFRVVRTRFASGGDIVGARLFQRMSLALSTQSELSQCTESRIPPSLTKPS